jgi:hypothetical protein
MSRIDKSLEQKYFSSSAQNTRFETPHPDSTPASSRDSAAHDRRDGVAMTKKWYNYFVSVDDASAATTPGTHQAASSSSSAAQTVAEIASGVAMAEPKFTAPVSNQASFDEIYKAAEIPDPPKGYSIFKVSEMLQSEHIRSMPADVKRSSVLVALDAAGVDIKDVIQDAVRRDRALDTFERVQERATTELESRKNQENTQIQAEIDKFVSEQRAKMQANNDEVTREKERFFGWRLKKQQEEKKISDAVAPFVSENPITTGGLSSAGASATQSEPTAKEAAAGRKSGQQS